MSVYDGPLRVPNKRAKKHPNAPKRSMSAFLFFSQVWRPKLKSENPHLKNTEVSVLLGNKWKKMPAAQKAEYQEQEDQDRRRYKTEMMAWNQRMEELKVAEEERKRQVREYQYPQNYCSDVEVHDGMASPPVYAQDYSHKSNVPHPGYSLPATNPHGYSPHSHMPQYQGHTFDHHYDHSHQCDRFDN